MPIDTLFSRRPASLATKVDPESFPHETWNEQQQRCQRYWDWYFGVPLEETVGDSDTPKFPLDMNIIKLFCGIHAAVLLGEVPEGPEAPIRTMVRPRRAPGKDTPPDEWQRVAEVAEDYVNQVWSENNGLSTQTEAAVISQFLGGHAWRVTYSPGWERPSGVRIELIYPDYFLPVYTGTEYWSLLEAYYAYMISAREAQLRYGIAKPSSNNVLYVEHWTRNERSLHIDDQARAFTVTIDGEAVDTGNSNPFDFVPFVYIPVLRAGDLFGLSLVDDLEGLVKEYNARMADEGEAVMQAVHRPRWGRNLRTDPRVRHVGLHEILDLGNSIPGTTHSEPDVFLDDPPTDSHTMAQFSQKLWESMVRIGRQAPVGFGEDEGSQRSALTLAFRMWPLTARARESRNLWTTGYNQVAKYVLRIAQMRGLVDLPADWYNMVEIYQAFAPMIPRDAEQELNALILARQTDGISHRTMIDNLNYVKDADAEFELMLEEKRQIAEIETPEQTEADDPQMGVKQPVVTSQVEE